MATKKRLLIADDSWVTRRYLRKLVSENFDVEISEAVDGQDALDKILENKPDCLLLDLLMPNLDGEEVLEELSKKSIQLPIIVLTADIQDTTKQKCLNMGIYCFINKPPDEADLVRVLSDIFS